MELSAAPDFGRVCKIAIFGRQDANAEKPRQARARRRQGALHVRAGSTGNDFEPDLVSAREVRRLGVKPDLDSIHRGLLGSIPENNTVGGP